MFLRNQLLILTAFLVLFRIPVYGYQEKGYSYIHPKPDAKYAAEETTLIIRFVSVSPDHVQNLDTFISISGDRSGAHPGMTKIASDQKTIIFKPDQSFQGGETVTVNLTPVLESGDESVEPLNFQFRVVASISEEYASMPDDPTVHRFDPNRPRPATQAQIMPNGVSVPSDFPHVEITVNDNPCTDYIFIDNRGGGPGRPYNVIFDNTGSPVWYIHPDDERRDFKVQPNGWITMMIRWGYGGDGWGFIALDENYNYVKTFRATDGYSTDEHELQVLEDGGYLLIGRRRIPYDLSPYGGPVNGSVRETCIQEFTSDDVCFWQWAALDHFDIADMEEDNPASGYIRFPHMNSIDVDDDGNIILSSRHLSEITKIERYTQNIIWRLSGAHNEFEFIDDPLLGTTNQHAARVLGGVSILPLITGTVIIRLFLAL